MTFANNVVLGGHVSVGDYTFLGGHVAIHQFVRIGEGVMMAGMSAARDDIIPFGFALGQTGALVGLNIVGLRRRGATQRRDASAAPRLSLAVLRRGAHRRPSRRGRARIRRRSAGRQNHRVHSRRRQAPADAAARSARGAECARRRCQPDAPAMADAPARPAIRLRSSAAAAAFPARSPMPWRGAAGGR